MDKVYKIPGKKPKKPVVLAFEGSVNIKKSAFSPDLGFYQLSSDRYAHVNSRPVLAHILMWNKITLNETSAYLKADAYRALFFYRTSWAQRCLEL